jgi:hypothetical protein
MIVYFCCKCALSGVDGKTIVRENWQSPHKSQNPPLVNLVIVHLPYIFRIFIFFREKGHLAKLVKIMSVGTLCVSVRFS